MFFFVSRIAWLFKQIPPQGPQPLQSEASYEKVPPFSRRRWLVRKQQRWGNNGEGATRWTERFHLQSGNPTKKLRRFLKLDRCLFLKQRLKQSIIRIQQSNKCWIQTKITNDLMEVLNLFDWMPSKLYKQKKTIQNIVSFRVRIFQKKKSSNFFGEVTSPTNPWTGCFFAVSNGFNPLGRFLPPGAPKIRVGSWCPLASGLGQKRMDGIWKSHGAFQKGIPFLVGGWTNPSEKY